MKLDFKEKLKWHKKILILKLRRMANWLSAIFVFQILKMSILGIIASGVSKINIKMDTILVRLLAHQNIQPKPQLLLFSQRMVDSLFKLMVFAFLSLIIIQSHGIQLGRLTNKSSVSRLSGMVVKEHMVLCTHMISEENSETIILPRKKNPSNGLKTQDKKFSTIQSSRKSSLNMLM